MSDIEQLHHRGRISYQPDGGCSIPLDGPAYATLLSQQRSGRRHSRSQSRFAASFYSPFSRAIFSIAATLCV
jgi:hypothetical protein